MKVNGPSQPPAPGEIDKAAKVATADDSAAGPAAKGGKTSFAEKVSGPPPAEARSAAGPARTSDVAVSDLAAELRAGKLTSRTAVDQVIDRVVARQVGPEAPPAIRDQVRAALRDAIENDPLLAGKLRQLD
jgi:hypothetical protein